MKTKNTAYFYLAIFLIMLILAALVFMSVQNEATVKGYVEQGYTLEEVRSYYSVAALATSALTYLSPFLVIAALFFCANSLLRRISAFESKFASAPGKASEGKEAKNSDALAADSVPETQSGPQETAE
ncbi:MAG: hypothetical protein LBC69_01795, partial [Eubacteriaceae bacterium]|nr:hypothetical protein [Eubacteriaceae bacterium]